MGGGCSRGRAVHGQPTCMRHPTLPRCAASPPCSTGSGLHAQRATQGQAGQSSLVWKRLASLSTLAPGSAPGLELRVSRMRCGLPTILDGAVVEHAVDGDVDQHVVHLHTRTLPVHLDTPHTTTRLRPQPQHQGMGQHPVATWPLSGLVSGFSSPALEDQPQSASRPWGTSGRVAGAHLRGCALWSDVDVVAVELLAQRVSATQRRVAAGQDQQGLGLTEAAERILHSQTSTQSHTSPLARLARL